LSPDRVRQGGIFNPGAVQRLVERFRQPGGTRSARHNMALVGILSTQLVVDQFIRGLCKSK
jgi:asparagine synthase (glutamine-hydrolysing)